MTAFQVDGEMMQTTKTAAFFHLNILWLVLTDGVCGGEVDIFVDDFLREILDNRFGLEQLFVMWFTVDDTYTIEQNTILTSKMVNKSKRWNYLSEK